MRLRKQRHRWFQWAAGVLEEGLGRVRWWWGAALLQRGLVRVCLLECACRTWDERKEIAVGWGVLPRVRLVAQSQGRVWEGRVWEGGGHCSSSCWPGA